MRITSLRYIVIKVSHPYTDTSPLFRQQKKNAGAERKNSPRRNPNQALDLRKPRRLPKSAVNVVAKMTRAATIAIVTALLRQRWTRVLLMCRNGKGFFPHSLFTPRCRDVSTVSVGIDSPYSVQSFKLWLIVRNCCSESSFQCTFLVAGITASCSVCR